MKFTLTFKTPDVEDQIDDEVEHLSCCTEKDKAVLKDSDGCYCSFCGENGNRLKARSVLKKFLKFGEYITVEFDTEKQTAEVIE